MIRSRRLVADISFPLTRLSKPIFPRVIFVLITPTIIMIASLRRTEAPATHKGCLTGLNRDTVLTVVSLA